MPKTIVWANPNKQDISTGLKAFDRQLVAVTRGAAIGGGQFNHCMRSRFDCTNAVNQTVPERHLQDYDVRQFEAEFRHVYNRDKQGIIRQMRELADDKGGFLLCSYYHYNGRNKIVHGFIALKDGIILRKWYTGPTRKSYVVIDTVAEYLGDKPSEAA